MIAKARKGGFNMKMVDTKNAPAAIGPYSQAVEAGNTLYISGQIPFDPVTMELIADDVRLQTHQCLKNITAIIEAANYSMEHIVKCGVFLKNMEDFSDVNEVYAEYFTTHKPARFCVEVARLPKDVKVEIDAIAVKI